MRIIPCLTESRGVRIIRSMTNSEARRFLAAIIRDANDALAALADGDIAMAALEVDCLAVDAAHVVEGLREMASEPRCCKDGCSECEPLNAAEYR